MTVPGGARIWGPRPPKKPRWAHGSNMGERPRKAGPGLVFSRVLVALPLAGFLPALAGEIKDVKGSSDPPLFPGRMPGYTISTYKTEGFASHGFWTAKGKKTQVEGRKTILYYRRPREVPDPGSLAILRNYENAIQQAGGRTVFSAGDLRTLLLEREGAETWAEIRASGSGGGPLYFLTIVEKGTMRQEITAQSILSKLEQSGSIALQIHFDTGKAVIRPESTAIVEQILEALRKNPALEVSIEGHTDDTGPPEGNKTLSEERARAVMMALVEKGIGKERLSAVGHGQEKPVATNATEEGRAANRRVELVKKK